MSEPEAGGWAPLTALPDVEQHATNIRTFLAMIDPETGYIEAD